MVENRPRKHNVTGPAAGSDATPAAEPVSGDVFADAFAAPEKAEAAREGDTDRVPGQEMLVPAEWTEPFYLR